MFEKSTIETAIAEAEARWTAPWPGFTSGQDRRTSDQALLMQMYGSVEHAARHDWQNAGRRLVDKTYIQMSMAVQGLEPMCAVTPERIAADLDPFVRGSLAKLREDLPLLDGSGRAERADVLVHEAAGGVFGSLHTEVAASRLLFFLCPQLPIFNLNQAYVQVLGSGTGYAEFVAVARNAYREFRVVAGDMSLPASDVPLIEDVLCTSDWWSRRVFHAALGLLAREEGVDEQAFLCTGEGAVSA